MAVKIRLARHGKKGKPYYHVVVADARAPRDGRYIENIGHYNPNIIPADIEVDRDKAVAWLNKGAQPTDTCRAILSYTGVLYKKHLQGGVTKGAFDQAEADRRFDAWLQDKEAKLQAKKDGRSQEVEADRKARLDAEKKKAQEIAAAVSAKLATAAGVDIAVEEVEAATEASAPTEETTPEPVAEATPEPVAEAPVEPVVEATPEPVAEAKPEPVAEETKEEPAAEAAPEPVVEEAVAADDLTKIEGIGPKIAETLVAAEVSTFAALAKTDVTKLAEIIAEVRGKHVPDTWPKQAEMAEAGQWDELKKWQDELDGGKPADAAPAPEGE